MKAITMPALLCALGAATVAAAQTPPHGPARKPSAPAQKEPVIDKRAVALLLSNQKAMLALKSYSAECRTTITNEPRPASGAARWYMLSRVTETKPNKIRYQAWESIDDLPAKGWRAPDAVPKYAFVCDGSKGWKQFGKAYHVDHDVSPEQIHTIQEPWSGFYTANDSIYTITGASRAGGALRDLRLAGKESVDGTPCSKIQVVATGTDNGKRVTSRTTFFIAADGLVRRSIARVELSDHTASTRDSTLTHITMNRSPGAGAFVYVPPKGVTSDEAAEKRASTLRIGSPAPAFDALDAHKHKVKLADFRGKVVVIDFWASWCGPCMASMPHTQQVIKRLTAQHLPVALLAVDDGEPRGDFDAWVAKAGRAYPSLTFVHRPPSQEISGSLYRVAGIPTQFVLDKKGIIRAAFAGYGGPTDNLEKAIRAALK
ncbi:MAG TPA: TlpA disulfide reductase family protein [Chthonomonadaceae bacterium]|nr:TlpA disulfide reductase family protein [Chthonomonadaceae bacterium]